MRAHGVSAGLTSASHIMLRVANGSAPTAAGPGSDVQPALEQILHFPSVP